MARNHPGDSGRLASGKTDMNQFSRSCWAYRGEIDPLANSSEFLSPLPDISSLKQEYRQAKERRGQHG